MRTEFPHYDPLIISLWIETVDVRRILCDDGSNADVLYAKAYRGLKLKSSKLNPVRTITYGVEPYELPVLRCIELPTMFIGTGLKGNSGIQH